MKCDELKDRWFTAYPVEGDQLIEVEVYGRKEVDETIAELIDANKKCQDITQQCFKREVDFRKRIDELNTKNQNSKRELRATKRALWMARKAHAVAMFSYWDSHYRDNPNAVYRNRTVDWLRNRWLLILDCCIKKEKEYK